MGEVTKIAWTGTLTRDGRWLPGATWNPWIGCAHASPGCLHCYAEDMMDTRYGKVVWGNGKDSTRVRTADTNWRNPYKWNRQAEQDGERKKVFCASLSDIGEDRPELEAWRAELLELPARTPWLDWLFLTKRPHLINIQFAKATGMHPDEWFAKHPNVWIGTSVENQEWADKRIHHLLGINASIRFVSVEPQIGPVSFRSIPLEFGNVNALKRAGRYSNEIDWVIIGGESGNGARDFEVGWGRSLIDECAETGKPAFFKQTGSVAAKRYGYTGKGEEPEEWPEYLRVRQFPKYKIGTELPGIDA